jgi:hypothetical protein
MAIETKGSGLEITIQAAGAMARLVAAGFADDLTSYLKSASRLSPFLQADEFGQALGLGLHEDKTVVIPLAGTRQQPLGAEHGHQP